jgi:hypothetical protein
VIAAVAIVAGNAARNKSRLHVASVYASVPPKPVQAPPKTKRHSVAFTGDAPWALSALPECFAPIGKSTGPLKYVLSKIPAGAQMVVPPKNLTYADCTLEIRGETVYVHRGVDRMRIPPPARVYVGGGTLALLRGASGGYELRVYEHL